MKRVISIITVCWIPIVFVVSATASMHAETISVPLPGTTVTLEATRSGQDVLIPGYGFIRDPGCPKLPARIYAVAIPPGAVFESLTVHSSTVEEIPGVAVRPVDPVLPIGDIGTGYVERQQELYNENHARIYRNDAAFPETIAEVVRTGGFRRYNIVDVRITPCRYKPVSGTLLVHHDIVLEISYNMPIGSGQVIQDYQPRMETRAGELILNYRTAQQWYPEISRRSLYDYVIITNEDLVTATQPLADWETLRGRSVQTVTTEWIATNTTGYDLAEKMRNFLRDKYPTGEWGIEDVCLVGAMAEVPMRNVVSGPDTDLYFAELSLPDSESWDANGDRNYLGTGDSCDYYAEVNIGRIPWSDPAIVQHICEKSVAYELNHDPSFKKNILLLGAFFWPQTDNAVLMEAKVDQPWMSDWTITRMYEQNTDYYSAYPCDYALLHANVISVWPSGTFAFVNYAGHGSAISCHIYGLDQPDFISSYDCSLLNDDYPAIIFADACSNSETQTLSIGAEMMKQGGVGFVGATRVAYGCPGWSDPSDGSSQSLDYYFTTGVISGEYTQGAAHQRALQEVYQMNGWSYTDLEMCEWTLYGNPNLSMSISNTSNGFVVFDSSVYSTDSTVGISVYDLDLNTDPNIQETVLIDLTTGTGDAEQVLLTETGPATAVFAGTINTQPGTPVQDNGVLDVVHGDVLTAIYLDEDNGHGGMYIEKTDTAGIDGIEPVITNIEVTGLSDDRATIVWTTDEPSSSCVVYGSPYPDIEVFDGRAVTDHAVTLTGLQDCTYYMFYVESTDVAGNTALDDNGGVYYAFTTWERIEILSADMDTDPQWSTEGLWAWGQPTGQGGGSSGAPDPTGGYTGLNVCGYNLNGNYPNNMHDPLYLTTGSFDCSEATTVDFEFRCWLSVEENIFDEASIDISSNGGSTWQNLWTNSQSFMAGGEWELWKFDISSYAAGHSNVKIRWGMGPTDYVYNYCGWNIDDVLVKYSQPCDVPTPTPAPTPTPDCIHDGDVNMDGIVTSGDAQQAFLIALGVHTPTYEEACRSDCNGDGLTTAGDAQLIFMKVLGMGECVDG
jgi:hypothetical protein